MYRAGLAKLDADAKRGIRALAEAKGDSRPHAREVAASIKKLSMYGFAEKRATFAPLPSVSRRFASREESLVGSQHYRLVGDALLVARMTALDGRGRALKGEPSDEPSTFLQYEPIDPVTLKPLRAASGKRGGLIFAEVAARFIAEKQRDPAYKLTEQTRGQYEAAFRLFDQWAKQPRLDDVDRSKASAFLDAISSLNPRWGRGPGVKALTFDEVVERFGGHKPGLSAKTVNRYAMAVGMVWQRAEDRDGYQGANPWTRQSRPTTKRRGSSETDKRPFTPRKLESS